MEEKNIHPIIDNDTESLSTNKGGSKKKPGGIFSGAIKKSENIKNDIKEKKEIPPKVEINEKNTTSTEDQKIEEKTKIPTLGISIDKKEEEEISNTKTEKKAKKKQKKEKQKKQVKAETIKNFKDALRAIKTYVYIQEWEKAEHAITEIKEKEANAFSNLKKNLKSNYKETQKQEKIYARNQLEIEKIGKRLTLEKFKYEAKVEKERFAIRFEKIKEGIDKLTKTGKNTEALNLLTHFLEENQERTSVVTFYDKEKKKILKNIQKKQKKDKSKVKVSAEAEALRLI